MSSQSPTDLILPQWKKCAKQPKDQAKPEDEKKSTSVKISESTKPILEEQTLLREKLEKKPAWRKERDSHPRRKTQPVVARPPSPNSSSFRACSAPPASATVPYKPPSPPSRRRSPSPNVSPTVTRSSSPQLDVSQDLSRKVEKALKARLYLLQQTGPNSFLIGGDSPDHKFRVIIGNQSCSCGKPFCLHLLFVMLRVFKVKENDPLLWSQSLKNFEVEELFSKFHARVNSRISKMASNQRGTRSRSFRLNPPPSPSNATSSSASSASSTSKEEEEICPICLLEMAEGESLTNCKGGCNNRLHQHCMEVWAGECRRQKESLICPLCRKVWVSDKSPTRSCTRTISPNVPTPLEQDEITLPHSDPIPREQVELARPWVEAFGDDLVSCVFSRDWIIRETALRRLSKDIVTKLTETTELIECRRAVEACSSLLEMMCGDPVYKVYVAALRTLRVMLAYTSCSTREERIWLQKTLFPVIEAILAKCADSNRRISALAIKVLLEMCKDQSGDLAVGKMLENPQNHSLGGLNFMLSNILVAPPEYSPFPWWLGRLYFLKKLLDEYHGQFELTSDCPNRNMDTEGLLTHEGGAWGSFDLTEMYEDNLMRLMAVLRYSMLAANCSHSKVTKVAVTILICCTGLSAKSPSAFIHVKKMVATLKPAQRGILQRQLASISQRNEEISSDCHSAQEQYDSTSMGSAYSVLLRHTNNRPSASGTHFGNDETDNFADTELQNLQAIVESLSQPRNLALPVTPPSSPTRELHLELEWSKCEGDNSFDSPRLPPIKMPIGKRCIDLIEQEEAEALAKALKLSSLLSSPQRIPCLTPTPDEDEMVIVFTQPESLEKAISDKHLYLEDIHWKKGELLGTGAFSSCYAARDVQTGTLMAVKQMSFCRNSLEEQEKVTQTILEEINLMAKLQHRHLIKCLGATRHRAHFNIFLEWMAGGAIANLISKYGPFEESVLVRYSMQILQGIDYLHQNGVIHRDIKGANILVDSTGQNIRIADFGAAARLASQITGAGEFQGQLLGTIAFMAPEVLRGECYGRSCDIWSVGCVIVEMATGRPPWNAHEHSNHLALIFKIACATAPPDIPQNLDPGVRDLLRRCFESKPEERPAASELLKHPLFRTIKSLPISTQTSWPGR